VLLMRDANTLVDVSSYVVTMLSGANFPVHVLPGFLLPIALALPLTYGYDALRGALLDTRLCRGRGTPAALATRMTLSRHSQLEDLTSLLAVRRTQLREQALRQQAYWRLTTAVLNLPSTTRQPSGILRQQPRAA
jgi:hypothetical protein